MQLFHRKLIGACIAGVALTGSIGLFSGGSSPLLCPANAEEGKWKYYGSSTCGGGSCHAASKPEDARPATEYTTWQSKDRHSKAFNTLFNDLSVAMNEALGIEDASKEPRCTKCHTTEGAYNVKKELHGEKYNAEDGVSCDGCHGPAEGWFDVHAKPHKYEDMLKLGMWDTRNIWRRADMCAYCHLQIEPELVGAGHPDLSFELVGHSRREPPHWYERQTWDAVRAWTVGAGVSLRECLTKLGSRIKNGKAAEDIDVAAAQSISYLDVFRHAVDVYGNDAEKALAKELDSMLKAKTLDKAKLPDACTKGAKAFDDMAKRLAKETPFTKDNIKVLWGKITGDSKVLKNIDEFGAEQVAGALVALYNSFKMGEGPRMKGELEVPAELEALLVRPTVYQPEDIFDGEEGSFNFKKWNERMSKAVGLVK